METAMKQAPDLVKQGYDDWVELLTQTNHLELLSNPYDVWIEAFHVGTVLERVGCMHAIQTQVQLAMAEDFDDDATMSVTDIKQIQLSLIKQVLKIIESKGLSR
jgi:hypothetical protein